MGFLKETMKNFFIKSCLLSFFILHACPVKPLSEDSVHLIAGGGAIGVGIVSGAIMGLIINSQENLDVDHVIFSSFATGMTIGVLSWWGIEKALKRFTPESRYILVQDLMQILERDLKDKRNRASSRTLAMVREIKTIVKDIARDTAYDVGAKKLYATCKDILTKLLTLEEKIEQKMSYNSVLTNLSATQRDSLIGRDFDVTSLLTYVQMRFGTNWPLIEARNSIKDFFGQITQAQKILSNIALHGKSSEKLVSKAVQAQEQALTLIQQLEQRMNSILQHPEYEAQKRLHEADRARKNDQAVYTQAMEKEREHQRELERARQQHEKEMYERELLEKKREQERRDREREKDYKLKKDVIERAPNAQVQAEVKF